MGLTDVEPIYCAEQIAIPPEMADILKAYAKEVIRRQPADVIEFSAIYFSNLAAATKALKHFEAPSQQSLRAMSVLLKRDPVSKDRIMEVAVQCGVSKETMTKIFSLERYAMQDALMPREVIVLLLTMAGANLKDALAGIFAVFAEEDGYLDAEQFVEIFETLAFLDQGIEIPEQLRQEVSASFRELPPVTLGAVYSHPAFADL